MTVKKGGKREKLILLVVYFSLKSWKYIYILIYGIISYNLFFKKKKIMGERGKLNAVLIVEFLLKNLK